MNSSKNKIISLIAFGAIILSGQAFANNSFLVAPGKIMFDPNSKDTKTLIVTNTGDESIRLDLEVEYLGIDRLKMGSYIKESVEQKDDISKNVRVSPKRLNLKPGERRDVRVQLSPISNIEKGDYRAHLVVKMLENSETKNVESQSEQMNMKLNIKMETAVALYAREGDYTKHLNATCIKGDDSVELKIDNESPYKFDGYIKVMNAESTPYVQLRESERKINFSSKGDGKNKSIAILDENKEKISEVNCN